MGFFLILLSFCTYPVILLVPKEQQAVWHGVIATDIFMALRAVLICVAAALLARPVKTPYFVYFIFLFASTLLSHHHETALFGTPNYYEGFFVITAYLILGSHGRIPEKALAYAVYIVGFFAFLQLIFGCYFNAPLIHSLVPKSVVFDFIRGPVYATFGNPNHAGLFCALLFPFFLARKQIISMGILLAVLLLAQSRGAILSVFITTLIQLRRQWKVVLIVTALCLLPTAPRMMRALHDSSGRFFIWKETLPMLKHHWVTGSGPGAYSLDFPQNTIKGEFAGFRNVIVDRPHNMYLNVWYSTGFLSLLVCAYTIFDLFKRCTDKAIRMSVLGFLIAGLFTDSVVSVTPYFMVILGAGL